MRVLIGFLDFSGSALLSPFKSFQLSQENFPKIFYERPNFILNNYGNKV